MPLEGILNWWKNWNSKRVDERMIENAPPTPVILVGTMGSGGETIFGVSSTLGPPQAVTETSGAGILAEVASIDSDTGKLVNLFYQGNPLMFDANGAAVGNSAVTPWDPIPSVVGGGCVITADGAGNIGSAAEVIAAVAGKQIDAYMICQVDTTGSYTTKWCQAHASPAVTYPDYHTAGHIAYMVAGYPYILRIMTTADAVNIGYDAGVNGNWPNSSNMYITGWSREM